MKGEFYLQMEDFEQMLYRKLTSPDEWGDNNELKYTLFGDNEWSAVDQSETVKKLKTKLEIDSWGTFG